MAASGSRSIVPFVLVGLAISLLIAVIVSNFAAESPDALQRAIINSVCQDAATEEQAEECLAEQEGEPVLQIQPAPMFGYEVTWLSGLVGVILTFAVGAGIVLLLRRTGGSSSGTSGRVR
ncbi:MAG: PDGLE domain-containing protein [Actinomycetota bacterium]|nr:PDGLE domain-containing protein [Actinomycetota bacterium]